MTNDELGASLLEGIPTDPAEAHPWVMAKHAELCEVAAELERSYHAAEDPAVREAIKAHGLAVEWSISYVQGKASELLPAAIAALELPLSPETEDAIQTAADNGAELATEQLEFWHRRGRQMVRESRRRRQPSRTRPAARRAQPRPRSRRERHVARATSSADSGDDGPSEPPPSDEDDDGGEP